MRVLVGCEHSQTVANAFRNRGHDAYSCDLLETDGDPKYHFQCDVRDVVNLNWDLAIFHPDCTYLCCSGLHWNKRNPDRALKTNEALKFIEYLWGLPIEKKCIENPQGCINTRLLFMPKPQYIQPYQFGEDASKKTGLWLHNLPYLIPTQLISGRLVNGRERWSNQTDSGQNRVGPSSNRWKLRSKTYPGIANAMAEQWS